MTSIDNRLQVLQQEFEEARALLGDYIQEAQVEELRVQWLGRKGKVTELFEDLRHVDKEERPLVGKKINEIKVFVEKNLEELKKRAQEEKIKALLHQKEALDISLPVSSRHGSLHPITLIERKLLDIFRRMGFKVCHGPEIDSDFFNFSALNIPADHPARNMQDTFFLTGKDELLLRTQTSNVQIHEMLKEKPPLKFVAPGRVFRVESDATHTPMFHQLECVLVDEGVSFAHLKGLIQAFTKALFHEDLKTRFRPSYFPFVEPGAEVDVQCAMCRGKGCRVCKNTGWIEIGGCGMIHPNVFEAVDYDSERWTGFAFGFGLDRMAMLAYGLPDLRQMFDGDYNYHNQFPLYL